MNERPTPETDSAYKQYQGLVRASIATGPLLEVSRRLERQRDELVEALENAERAMSNTPSLNPHDLGPCNALKQARTALAKVKGGK